MSDTRIFDITSFSWGESDSYTAWPKNSFYSWENIEIRKDLSGVTLTSKLVDTWWSISGDIIFMENLEKYGFSGIVVATDTGNVYLDGTLKKTLASGTSAHNRIIGMWAMKISWTNYLYFITRTASWAGKIHRSTTNLATWNEWYKSFDTVNGASSTYAYSISINWEINFAINNCIINIDVAETVSTLLTLPEIESVVGFTQFQNQYKIYANFWTTGVQYIWDWTATAADYRQEWDNLNVVSVVNNGAYDYAILWKVWSEAYNDLYLISGTQKQELRVNLEASNYSRVFNWYMSIREDIVYISGGKTGESSNYGIYTYGNYYPWTSKSLVQSYSLGVNSFLFHVHSWAASYFANNDDKVYKIEHNNPPTTNWMATSWYVTTLMYEGNVWEELTFLKTILAYELETGTSIKLYCRTNFGVSWNLIKEITDNTKKHIRISANEIQSLNLGKFYGIQFKIELIGNSYYTPKAKRLTTYLNVVNNG